MAVKLTYIEFLVPQKFDNSSITAINDDRYGALSLDDFSVYVGNRGFPLTALKHWIVDKIEPVECPECKESFQDARALGAHRYFQHKVKGSARQK